MDMSIHDVSGVVGWCLGAYSEVENTYVHHLHTFLHTGSGLYNPLHHSLIVSRPYIYTAAIQHLYSSCIGCIAIQLYSSYTVYILYSIPLELKVLKGADEAPAIRLRLIP